MLTSYATKLRQIRRGNPPEKDCFQFFSQSRAGGGGDAERFKQQHKGVAIQLQVENTARCCAAVSRGEVDVAVVGGQIPANLEHLLQARRPSLKIAAMRLVSYPEFQYMFVSGIPTTRCDRKL